MRKIGTLLLVAIVFSVVVSLYAAEKEVTLTGTLVDTKCYLADNANTGNDHMGIKGCGTICLKGGQPGALLTKDKKFYPILASSQALAPYAGQEIRARHAAQRRDPAEQGRSQPERQMGGSEIRRDDVV